MALDIALDRIVDISEFKRRPAAYLKQVQEGRPVTIRQRRRGDFIVIRREDLGRMVAAMRELETALETAELLLDPKVRERLERGLPERGVPVEEARIRLGLGEGR